MAIDLPGGRGQSEPLPEGTNNLGIIPYFINKHRTAGQEQKSIVVSPSASGGTTHPYILSLTDETAGDLDAYVPVAPVGVSTLQGDAVNPSVLENLRVRPPPPKKYAVLTYAAQKLGRLNIFVGPGSAICWGFRSWSNVCSGPIFGVDTVNEE